MSGPGLASSAHAGSDRAAIRADAIVVAAGRSTRMNGTDKLTADLAGRPLLARTLEAIATAPEVARIVVVAAAERVDELKAATWLPAGVVDVVAGGPRRQESVHRGFLALDRFQPDEGGVVLVHDGARPLVTRDLVGAVARETARHGAAIPVLPVTETLKRIDGDVVGATVDRSGLGSAQTPQGARRDLLRAAYARFPPDGPETWTDEASLLEAAGVPVHVVPGDPANLKVTRRRRPGSRRLDPWRCGRHANRDRPRQPSVRARVARSCSVGSRSAGAPRLHGHSDGDVVLHAIADALLGAAALGDLGRLFPADARTPRGIASGELLAAVDGPARRGRLAARLGRRDRDRGATAGSPTGSTRCGRAIGGLLGLDAAAVNVKASTGNLDGADGAGRSISAMAIAMVSSTR